MWKRRWQQAGQALKILQKPSSFRCEFDEDVHDDYHDELANDDCDDDGGDCGELIRKNLRKNLRIYEKSNFCRLL